MTTKNLNGQDGSDTLNEPDGSDTAGGGQQNIEELVSQLNESRNAIAKLKNINKQVITERDELKKSKPTLQNEEDYKVLWQQSNDKLSGLLEKTKSATISAALTTQLQKAGIIGDWLDAAVQLADKSLIEWDEETGIDGQSVIATVQKLKSKHSAMFEKKVGVNLAKEAAEGTTSEKTISRAEFDRLMRDNPQEWQRKRKLGYKVA